MKIDLMLLVFYGLAVITGKPDRRTSAVAVFMWFLVSILVAIQGWTALPTFTIYWVMACTLCVFLALRGTLIVLWAVGAMCLLQLAMVADALFYTDETPLYNSYWLLSLIINLFIMLTTYIHGQGLESVDNKNNSHHLNGHGHK